LLQLQLGIEEIKAPASTGTHLLPGLHGLLTHGSGWHGLPKKPLMNGWWKNISIFIVEKT